MEQILRSSLYGKINCDQIFDIDSSKNMVFQEKGVQIYEESANSFAGCTLILPAVSVGNIGQLAVDLILENAKPTPIKIGKVFHPALEPVVATASEPNDKSPKLMTPCELYRNEKMLFLQFHSPVGKRLRNEFVDFLVNWIDSVGISKVVCLTSSFASERIDSQLMGSQHRYLSYDISETLENTLQSINVMPLELRKFPAPAVSVQEIVSSNSESSETDRPMIHGGGIAQTLFDTLRSRNISVLHLIVFASEGVNIQEAEELYNIANASLKFTDSKSIVHPKSWTNSIFYGEETPPDIF